MKKLTTTSLLLGLLSGACTLTVDAKSPTIVVGIMVDQLRTDYLEQLRPYFGTKGFNRLISEGVYIPSVDFRNTVSDAPTGTAVVYTGAWPSVNGVASAEVLDQNQKKKVPVLVSETGKSKTDYSPQNLRLSTIADEIYINNGNLTKIYSIAGDPQVAVISAGHAGTSALYLDEYQGKWTTPVYYGTLPSFIFNKSHTSPLSSKIANSVWKPLNPPAFYSFGNSWNKDEFSYKYAGGTRDTYLRFRDSAPFNTELTNAAIDILKAMQSGSTSDQPGMLNIAYSLSPINYDFDNDNRPELVDSYMRLDSELGRLLDAIDRDYGKGNAVIFLSSTGYATEPDMPDFDAKIPTGEITLMKAESLLNSYLSATFGNGDYVALIKNGQLYLDSKEIERKGLDIKKLRAEAKGFLLRMGGVSEAFTIDEVIHTDNKRAEEIGLGIDPKNAPDLFLFFTPGWTVTDDNAYPSTSYKVRLATPPTPAIIMAPDVLPEVVTETVEATSLAPTISSAINIRAPNGAGAKPIVLKRRNY